MRTVSATLAHHFDRVVLSLAAAMRTARRALAYGRRSGDHGLIFLSLQVLVRVGATFLMRLWCAGFIRSYRRFTVHRRGYTTFRTRMILFTQKHQNTSRTITPHIHHNIAHSRASGITCTSKLPRNLTQSHTPVHTLFLSHPVCLMYILSVLCLPGCYSACLRLLLSWIFVFMCVCASHCLSVLTHFFLFICTLTRTPTITYTVAHVITHIITHTHTLSLYLFLSRAP